MRLAVVILGLVTLSLVELASAESRSPQWTTVSVGAADGAVVSVATNPGDPEEIFAATSRALYGSADGGRQWHERFRLPAQVTISRLAVSRSSPIAILVATNQGLYGSFDGGFEWSRLFRGGGEGEQEVTVVRFHPTQHHVAYLGTRGGAFRSDDGGRHWDELPGPSEAREVVDLTGDPQDTDVLWLLTTRGLFLSDLDSSEWHRVLGAPTSPEDQPVSSSEVDSVEPPEESAAVFSFTAVAVHPQYPVTVYVGSSRGVQVSTDRGRTWAWLPQAGLQSLHVSRLLLQAHSPVMLYAATPYGVALYQPDDETWRSLGKGLASSSIHDIAGTPHRLWAASEEGLLQLDLPLGDFGAGPSPSPRELLANFVHEPTIAQAREAAIRYAEVHPDKIRWWRRQAAVQALLPTVDIGWDHDTSHDTSIDEGSFPNFQLLSTKDRDSGVDFSISWDLGELMWNDDQTSIDVRSKLMVQLRDDIVDQITRTYYERRRLQVVMLTQPEPDPKKLLEQELRLQELTALIDGLTGGYFSQQLGVPGNRQEEIHERTDRGS